MSLKISENMIVIPLPIFWDGDPKNNLKIALAELQQQQHSHPTTKKGHKWSHV